MSHRKPKIIETSKTRDYIKKVYRLGSGKENSIAQITTFKNNNMKILSTKSFPDIKFEYLHNLDRWYQKEISKYFKDDNEILDFFI